MNTHTPIGGFRNKCFTYAKSLYIRWRKFVIINLPGLETNFYNKMELYTLYNILFSASKWLSLFLLHRKTNNKTNNYKKPKRSLKIRISKYKGVASNKHHWIDREEASLLTNQLACSLHSLLILVKVTDHLLPKSWRMSSKMGRNNLLFVLQRLKQIPAIHSAKHVLVSSLPHYLHAILQCTRLC